MYPGNYDPDFDPSYSASKRGGYKWAGAWIDPSYGQGVGGPKEHPTMSLEDSYKKQFDYQRNALRWKARQQEKFFAEDNL